MGSVPESPAFQQLSASNHGPAIIVASYILLVLAVATVVTRLVTRIKVTRKLQLDDWLILPATLLYVGQTIAVTFAANHGLGRHRDTLSVSSFDVFSKAFYAADIATVFILVLAKASTIFLIMSIHPPKHVRLACQCTLLVSVLWSVGLMFAVAFQCSLSAPWNYETQCINQVALNANIGVWNIVTDLALVILPFLLMRNVQISERKRWIVVGLFASRIVVPGFAVAAVVQATRMYTVVPRDLTWDAVGASLWIQAVISLSIITACVPCIKRFLADMSSGMIMVNISPPLELSMKNVSSSNDQHRPSGSTLASRKGSFVSKFFSRTRSGRISSSIEKSKAYTLSHSQSMKSALSRSTKVEESSFDSTKVGRYLKTTPDFCAGGNATNISYVERSDSMKGLREDIIVQTIDYEVNFEGETRAETKQSPKQPQRTKSFNSTVAGGIASSMGSETYDMFVKGSGSVV